MRKLNDWSADADPIKDLKEGRQQNEDLMNNPPAPGPFFVPSWVPKSLGYTKEELEQGSEGLIKVIEDGGADAGEQPLER